MVRAGVSGWVDSGRHADVTRTSGGNHSDRVLPYYWVSHVDPVVGIPS